ncbi:hypothetical protein HMPREF0291_11585 [Corynebacterium genitalium ATCC 33030]|uniref:Uncharacterized protein n=1 Tax=Corynebacterium genitalium ATCC 33030 TaxID=585529 RepID=D7WCP7_9CORY|nr:hypothetical protein HMPREF0291_11585 [Corynebacterium genitalium ATCC 33030]
MSRAPPVALCGRCATCTKLARCPNRRTDTQIILLEPVRATEDTYPWQKKRTAPVTRIRFYAGGVL